MPRWMRAVVLLAVIAFPVLLAGSSSPTTDAHHHTGQCKWPFLDNPSGTYNVNYWINTGTKSYTHFTAE